MTKTVGLVGVGAMGRVLIERLRLAGNEVRAYDVGEAARKAAADGGAVVVASPKEAAHGVPIVHVFVNNDHQVIDSTLGADGVLAGAAKGTVVILHSTILPVTTRRIGKEAAARGIDVIDVTVTAVPAKLKAGEAVWLAGGPEQVVESVRDHLLSVGKSLYWFGPLGSGNVAKLAKNLLNAGERVMLAEVLRIAETGGVDPTRFLEMASDVAPNSSVAAWRSNFIIENGRSRHRPATNMFSKDAQLAADYAESLGLDVPLTRGTGATGLAWTAQWAKEKAQRSK